MPSSIVRLSGDSALAPSPYAYSATTDGASRPIFVAGASRPSPSTRCPAR
ncbi:hypothetical protein [Serinicoccus sp. CUA-874]|nr:hypothetical protein [Serinicoccus sp. CUA-874]